MERPFTGYLGKLENWGVAIRFERRTGILSPGMQEQSLPFVKVGYLSVAAGAKPNHSAEPGMANQ